MDKLNSPRLPLAWLLMFTIFVAGAGIVLMLMMQAPARRNAVLIESVEDSGETVISTAIVNERPAVSQASTATSTYSAPPTAATISIYISGAVKSPGVYSLPAGSRVDDALKAAGGASNEADLEQINLAAYLSDEEHVRVPKLGDSPAIVVQSTPTRPQDANKSGFQATPHPPAEKLDLNDATALELEGLPGIGSVLAARIVADRDQRGPFRTVDDIMRVPGIKEGLLARFRDYVTVSP